MEVLERRITRTTKNLKGDKSLQKELDILKKVNDFLAEGKSARAMDLTEEEAEFIKTLDLLSYKPIIYVANVSEDDAADSADNTYDKAALKVGVDFSSSLRRFGASANSPCTAFVFAGG